MIFFEITKIMQDMKQNNNFWRTIFFTIFWFCIDFSVIYWSQCKRKTNFFQKVSFLDKITFKKISQNSINILFLFLIEDNRCPEKKKFFISWGPLGKGNELGKNPLVGSKVRVLSWIPRKDFFLTSLFFPGDPETQN